MNEFDKRYKVDSVPQVPKNKTVEILSKYIDKEKEMNRIFDEEDGIDVNALDYEPGASSIIMRIESLIKYREVRTKQAFLSKLNRGDNSRARRQQMSELDRDRRTFHNIALTALKGLVEFGKRYNLEPIYSGRLLTEEEIENHLPECYDIRMEMTDAFLKILKDIDKCSFDQIEVLNPKEIKAIKQSMEKVDRDYGVTKSLENDDGDIEFKDFKDEYRGF